MLVFAGAAALTFAAVYVNALRAGSGIATPQFLRAVLPNPRLGLRVEVQGDGLLVDWDRRSPLVRSALNGVLRIEDGEQPRVLHLDAAQVAGGTILYKPASGDVTFRLEVQTQEGARAMESVRVLDSLKPAGDGALKPDSNGSPPSVSPPVAKPAEPPASRDQSKPHAVPPVEAPDGKSISVTQPARALRQVMPDIKALGLDIAYGGERVEVRVVIDRAGHVKSARVISGGHKVNQSLVRAALTAARQWQFEPATRRGQPVESEHSILFDFRPSP